MMRILRLTSNDAKTGGAISVTRLHDTLQKLGYTDRILSFGNVDISDTVQRIKRSLFWHGLDFVADRVSDTLALPDIYRPSIPVTRQAIDDFQPDVIHLHWTYSGGVPLSMLPWLTRHYPLVWTFHDMYAFTGGCTNSIGCERWQTGCGDCPQLCARLAISSMPPLRHDTTAQLWRLKRQIYKKSKFSIVCASRWMTELARQSPLLVDKTVQHVPHGLDTDYWKPLDKKACKLALDIAPNKRVLLFVGKPDNVFAYPGRQPMFCQALAELRRQAPHLASQIVLVLVGERGQEFSLEGYDVLAVRRVTSPAMLRICYNAADLLLDPTQFESFGGIILEALACGTPVIASNVGGVPDLVRHKENGYLARSDAPQEFAEGIMALLNDGGLWMRLSHRARQVAVEEFQDQFIAQKMVSVYTDQIMRSG